MRAPFLPGGKKGKEDLPMGIIAFMMLFFSGLGVVGLVLFYLLWN